MDEGKPPEKRQATAKDCITAGGEEGGCCPANGLWQGNSKSPTVLQVPLVPTVGQGTKTTAGWATPRGTAGLHPTPVPCPNCLLVPHLATAPPTCSLRSSFPSSCASRREGNLHFLVRQEMTS